MDSLTSFLLSEHAEVSLDALTDNMLANLPHQNPQYDALAPMIPFSTELTKTADYSGALDTKVGLLQQQLADPLMPLPWDFSLPAGPADVPPEPFQVASQPLPMFAESQATPFAAAAAPASQPVVSQDAIEPQPGSSGSSKRTDDPDIAKLQERVQKQKEKNARNQRQFRKRAKERAVKIEEQVQQLSSKLQDLEMEKQGLMARNKVLEAALASAKVSADKNTAGCPLASMLAAAPNNEEPDVSDTIMLKRRDGGPLTLTIEQVKKMTWGELTTIWKEMVNNIAMALVTSKNSLEGTSGQRLKELLDDMSNLMRSVAMNNAALIHQHLSRRMDVHSMQEQQPPPGFYSSIIEMMQLTTEQREQILALRHIKLVSLARLVQERKELQARLQACNEVTANPVESVPCLGLGAEFPHLMEVAERLNDNVAQLHRSVCLFMGQIWRQVLNPIQAGTFMVQAFPFAPDMLALANAMAEQAQAPSVKQIFNDVLTSPSLNPLQLTWPQSLQVA